LVEEFIVKDKLFYQKENPTLFCFDVSFVCFFVLFDNRSFNLILCFVIEIFPFFKKVRLVEYIYIYIYFFGGAGTGV
jgi:hypothetical protein